MVPVALFDSDAQGRNTAQSLRNGLYASEPNLILEIESFTGVAGLEIEDLIPAELIARELDRWLRSSDVPFAEEMRSGAPIVPQIEAWATGHRLELPKPGWKVELAKRVKQRMLAEGPEALSLDVRARWEKLFVAFQTARTGAAAKATA